MCPDEPLNPEAVPLTQTPYLPSSPIHSGKLARIHRRRRASHLHTRIGTLSRFCGATAEADFKSTGKAIEAVEPHRSNLT